MPSAGGIVNISGLLSGVNIIKFWAVDAAGNQQSQPSTHTWIVRFASMQPPKVNITGGPPQRPAVYGWTSATVFVDMHSPSP